MITIKMDKGQSNVNFNGDTCTLLAEAICVVKALYCAFGGLKVENFPNYGKEAQKSFKDSIFEEADRIFSEEEEEEKEERKEVKAELKETLDSLEESLLELMKTLGIEK